MGFLAERGGPKRSSKISPKNFLFVTFHSAADAADDLLYPHHGSVYRCLIFSR